MYKSLIKKIIFSLVLFISNISQAQNIDAVNRAPLATSMPVPQWIYFTEPTYQDFLAYYLLSNKSRADSLELYIIEKSRGKDVSAIENEALKKAQDLVNSINQNTFITKTTLELDKFNPELNAFTILSIADKNSHHYKISSKDFPAIDEASLEFDGSNWQMNSKNNQGQSIVEKIKFDQINAIIVYSIEYCYSMEVNNKELKCKTTIKNIYGFSEQFLLDKNISDMNFKRN
jgi:hypothetical protein